MPCRARVITGAVITRDDLYAQFAYQPKCPTCGFSAGQVGTGVAYPGTDFHETEYCNVCKKLFDIKIVRDE